VGTSFYGISVLESIRVALGVIAVCSSSFIYSCCWEDKS